MSDPDDIGPLHPEDVRIYTTPEGTITLRAARGVRLPYIQIPTIGRDATSVQSPALEAWVRRVTQGPEIREVWTGEWELDSDAALDRIRRRIVAAGSSCTAQTRRADMSEAGVREAWRRFLEHPRSRELRLDWPTQTFEAVTLAGSEELDVSLYAMGGVEARRRGHPAWEAFVATLPAALGRKRHAEDRETIVRLPVGDPTRDACLTPALASIDTPPSKLTIRYRAQ